MLITIGADIGYAAVVEGRYAIASAMKGASGYACQVNIGVVDRDLGIVDACDSCAIPDEVVASVAFKADIDVIDGVLTVAFDNNAVEPLISA